MSAGELVDSFLRRLPKTLELCCMKCARRVTVKGVDVEALGAEIEYSTELGDCWLRCPYCAIERGGRYPLLTAASLGYPT